MERAIVSIMNIEIAIIPLMSILFGSMYFYNSKEFTELLLSQPLKRNSIFAGQYLGLSLSLVLGFGAGVLVPFIFYGILTSSEIWNFSILLITGIAMTFIFTAIAYLIAIYTTNKIKGFGIAIICWLFFAVIYDGLILLVMALFYDYPLEHASLVMTIINPIDLARILILLKLDISALMGFTGALFNKFFGSAQGMLISAFILVLWISLPYYLYLRKANTKDF
jgi:Cu-processing system permease protein